MQNRIEMPYAVGSALRRREERIIDAVVTFPEHEKKHSRNRTTVEEQYEKLLENERVSYQQEAKRYKEMVPKKPTACFICKDFIEHESMWHERSSSFIPGLGTKYFDGYVCKECAPTKKILGDKLFEMYGRKSKKSKKKMFLDVIEHEDDYDEESCPCKDVYIIFGIFGVVALFLYTIAFYLSRIQ